MSDEIPRKNTPASPQGAVKVTDKGPPQYDTRRMQRVQVPGTDLSPDARHAELVSLLRDQSKVLDKMADNQLEFSVRLDGLEAKMEQYDARATKHSGGVRQLTTTTGQISLNDAGQERAIAELICNSREAKEQRDRQDKEIAFLKMGIAENTSITRKAAEGFFKEHPAVSTAFVAFVMALLGFATSWLSAHGGTQ